MYRSLLLGLSEPVDNLLDNFAEFSPNSLTDIRIVNWECSIDALKRFFESCRERTLFYFGFLDDTKDIITKNHEMIIRKYFKEKVVKKAVVKSESLDIVLNQ
jgi:hypothetical protein